VVLWLFNDDVSIATLNDIEGDGNDLFEDTITAFTWRDCGLTHSTLIRIGTNMAKI
jgi:hypothetical protein